MSESPTQTLLRRIYSVIGKVFDWTFFAVIFGISSIAFFAYYISEKFPESFSVETIFIAALLFVAISVFALLYLDSGLRYFVKGRLRSPDAFYNSGYEINFIKQPDRPEFGACEFDESDKQIIIENIQKKLESDSFLEYAEGLRTLLASKISEDYSQQLFRGVTDRLTMETRNLARRGNLNLILGMSTTLIGLFILAYAVYDSPKSQSVQELAAYFVPRVSLVLLVEVFAYFFLRLYKQSLEEIKYFQNEITNVESRMIAMYFASRVEDPALGARLAEELARTERNFILGKDQTTVDLEKERIAKSTYADVAAAIKDLLKSKNEG